MCCNYTYSQVVDYYEKNPNLYQFLDHTITNLKTTATIVSESESDGLWKLEFVYDNILRTLHFYHSRDFLKTWPIGITNIKHVMVMGSYCWNDFITDKDSQLISMLQSRTISPWKFYALSFNHKHFPVHINHPIKTRRKDEKIAIVEIGNTSDSNWINQLLDMNIINNLSVKQNKKEKENIFNFENNSKDCTIL